MKKGRLLISCIVWETPCGEFNACPCVWPFRHPCFLVPGLDVQSGCCCCCCLVLGYRNPLPAQFNVSLLFETYISSHVLASLSTSQLVTPSCLRRTCESGHASLSLRCIVLFPPFASPCLARSLFRLNSAALCFRVSLSVTVAFCI